MVSIRVGVSLKNIRGSQPVTLLLSVVVNLKVSGLKTSERTTDPKVKFLPGVHLRVKGQTMQRVNSSIS